MRETILEGLQEHLTAKRACVALGIGIAAYELACSEDQLISRGFDRALEHSPLAKWATILGTLATTAHLLNVPEKLGLERADPFVWLHSLTR